MNIKKEKIVDQLKKLKENGAVAVKAEFEAEGSRKDELIMLRELVYQADMRFIIKIGGCEAVHDLDQCKLLDANGIMAPMIETPFSMFKFKHAADKVFKEDIHNIEWIINAETKTCLDNFESILNEGSDFLNGVTVGRSDLSASLGIKKSEIESQRVYELTETFVDMAKKRGFITNFGGNIGVESIPFIKKMSSKIDRFETRKIVLSAENDAGKLKNNIQDALRFELMYLDLKSCYYGAMAVEDNVRKERLKKQIEV